MMYLVGIRGHDPTPAAVTEWLGYIRTSYKYNWSRDTVLQPNRIEPALLLF